MPILGQCLSYLLSLLFVIVSLNPAQAMMNADRAMGESPVGSEMNLSQAPLSEALVAAGSSAHDMAMAMSQGDDCQSDCDCCPGLCSAYLPTSLSSSTFPPAVFVRADTSFQRKISASSTLFRPPITH
ncbi:MAG: hypothetical protein KBT88_04265 [Gammaproteobacteria bacterium]|nr:hypothetical protein [Gammaproteobacteria bacterium]MBQ0838978.1 hypothetical protein [Gammaproteobacteria bacterium]